MKKIVALVAFMSLFGASTVLAAPTATVVGTPEVDVRDNPECQEITFTYMVDVTADSEFFKLKDVAFDVFDAEDNLVAQVANDAAQAVTGAAFTTGLADIDTPCADLTDYEVSGDEFFVPAGLTEDFQIRVWFTPEEAGDYYTTITGFEYLFGADAQDDVITQGDKRRVTSGGGGACLNCFPEEEEEEEFAGVAETSDNSDEIIEILGFIQFLIDLGLINLE